MAKLSNEKIAQIQKVYAENGTYSGTAKIVGCSPATVKKYCSLEIKIEPISRIPFNGIIPKVEDISWPSKEHFCELGRLTEEELLEIQELWEEI